jgi:hypothetical protein
MSQIAKGLGIAESCLHCWLKIADVDDRSASVRSAATPPSCVNCASGTSCRGPRHGPVDDPIHRGHHGLLPREKQGVASALNDVTRQIGTALGIALLGALVAAGYCGTIDDRLGGIPQGAADSAREGIAIAVEAAGSTGTRAQDLLHAAQQSFVDGWQRAMWAGVTVMGPLFLYIALRSPKNTVPAVREKTEASEAVAVLPHESRAHGKQTAPVSAECVAPRLRGARHPPRSDPTARRGPEAVSST